jgi:putative ABC transport system substrate-binding protein
VTADWVRDNETATRQIGLALELVDLGRDPALRESVFDAVRRRGIGAAVIIEAPTYWNGRARLAELAIKYRVALMVPYSEYTEAGGVMSYGADIDEVHGRAAGIVDRILKGARPEDIPVELPTRFPLIINLKTVKALGLTIPLSVLARERTRRVMAVLGSAEHLARREVASSLTSFIDLAILAS